MRVLGIVAVTALLTFVGCGQNPPPTDTVETGLDQYFDSSVQGRVELENMIRAIPDEERTTNSLFVLVDPQNPGMVYANRQATSQQIAYNPNPPGFAVANYNEQVGPAGVDQPRCYSASGPFHRKYSEIGYDKVRGRWTLPSLNDVQDNEDGPNGDTAYIYTGGFGGSDSNAGSAVDAGLKHNTGRKDWTPFIRYQTSGSNSAQIDLTGRSFQSQLRNAYPAGRSITWSFKILPSQNANDPIKTYLMFNFKGLREDNTTLDTFLSLPIRKVEPLPIKDWDVLARYVRLKLMTSIGQKPQDLTTDSFVRGILWDDVQIGKPGASYHDWGFYDRAYGSPCNVPTYNKIYVTQRDPSGGDKAFSVTINPR